jgi:hypothetical protein
VGTSGHVSILKEMTVMFARVLVKKFCRNAEGKQQNEPHVGMNDAVNEPRASEERCCYINCCWVDVCCMRCGLKRESHSFRLEVIIETSSVIFSAKKILPLPDQSSAE